MKTSFIVSITFVICTILGVAHAEMKVHGAWYSDTDPEFTEAYTTNESGSSLGMVCFRDEQDCYYYLSTDITCDHDSITYGLINADYGAYTIELHCVEFKFGGESEFLNIFGDFDLIDEIVLDNYNFGIALPMDDGLFKVIRFDLTGSNEAIDEALDAVISTTGEDFYL